MQLESKSPNYYSAPQMFWVKGMPVEAKEIKTPVANTQLREKIVKLAMDCHNKYSHNQLELSSSSNYVKIKMIEGPVFEGRVTSVPMKNFMLTHLNLWTQPTISHHASEMSEQNAEHTIPLAHIEWIEDSQMKTDEDDDFMASLAEVCAQFDKDLAAMKAKDNSGK